MSEDDYRKIFVKNLSYYMNLNNKNQTDLMNDLGLGSSTISSWCTGAKMPRMGKIQMLADYFNIEKSDLLEDEKSSTKNDKLTVRGFEKDLVTSYRKADELDKAIVRRTLKLDDVYPNRKKA